MILSSLKPLNAGSERTRSPIACNSASLMRASAADTTTIT
jgi:hypothetical protein